MVKFSILALATAIASVSATSTTKKTINLGNRQLRANSPSTKALMKHAIKVKGGAARRLDGEAEEMQITGSHYMQFDECIDVTTYDQELIEDENLVSYAQSGTIVPVSNFVTFYLTDYSGQGMDYSGDRYMVPLATWLTNMAAVHAEERQNYCEGCDYEYCYPEQEEEEEAEEEQQEEEQEEGEEEEDREEEGEEGEEGEGEEGEGEGEDRKRKLKKTKRKLSAKAIERKLANGKVMVSCSQCDAYSCFENEGQEDEEEENENAYKAQTQEELDQQVAELIQQLGECQETESVMGDLALSVGAQCTAEGDGVELAVFANEECTWLVPGKSASSILPMYDEDGNSLKTAMSSVETYIKKALTESISCQAIEYYSPDENGEEEEDNNEDEQNEASEYCQGVFDEETVSWSNCVADGEEEAEEEQQDDEVDYSWVTYDIKSADDVGTVCYTLSAMDDETRASTGHVYDADAAGSWYERNKKGQIITGDEPAGMSGGAIFAIVVFVLAVVGGAAYVLMKKKTGAAKTDYQGGEMS